MGRKSKQAGTGHYPMTHHERTKKFASSSYGTTTTRLAGDTQVAFGSCSLSLTPIMDHTSSNGEQKGKSDSKACAGSDTNTSTTIAMVTPSGHLYAKQAIYEYLLTKTQEFQDQKKAYEQQQKLDAERADSTEAHKRQQQEAFEQSNQLAVLKKQKIEKIGDGGVLKKTSYWLPDMQPAKVEASTPSPNRPSSPYSGRPLRRKDLREVALVRSRDNKNKSEDVLCAISGKPIRMQPAVAYWTKDRNEPGIVALKDVFNMTVAVEGKTSSEKASFKGGKAAPLCPLTNARIKHVVALKSGGSGFAAHNMVEVKTYKPTIT